MSSYNWPFTLCWLIHSFKSYEQSKYCSKVNVRFFCTSLYIGFALRVDTSYIFAIIILLFAFVNVFTHASTLSLHIYIHALIQAQRIILLVHTAQPYRLRIYFKPYGSRSPVTETYRHLSTPSSRPYRPYYTLTRTLTATHSAVKAAVTYPQYL